jgi:hypothetical protein
VVRAFDQRKLTRGAKMTADHEGDEMRRCGVVLGALVLAAGVVVPAGTVGAAVRHVDGSVSGTGHFEPASSCTGTVEQLGSGTFSARDFGVGTYRYDACITQGSSNLTFTGTASFTTHSGASLDGTIGGTGPLGQYPTFVVTVTGGTRRYRHATGTLTMGELTESNLADCDPRVGICLSWSETGPLSGRLRHVRHRR